jgi:GNAT superfamily N-acetyltransferase
MEMRRVQTINEYKTAQHLMLTFWREHEQMEQDDATGESLLESFQELKSQCQEKKNNRYLFLLNKIDSAIGICHLGYFETPRHESKCTWVILDFFIAPLHRHKGVGTKFVLDIVDFIQRQNLQNTKTKNPDFIHIEASNHVNNPKARRFWNKMGFQTVATGSFSDRTLYGSGQYNINVKPIIG